MLKKLMCIGIDEWNRTDGTTGYIHLFIDAQGKGYQGFWDYKLDGDLVYPEAEKFDETRAREYSVARKFSNDKLVTRVLPPS